MGLGKTMQCAAFLAGMVHSRLIQRAIVLAPKTLLGQWAAELRRCGLAGRVFEYHGTSAADRKARVHVLQPVAGFEDRMSLRKTSCVAPAGMQHCQTRIRPCAVHDSLHDIAGFQGADKNRLLTRCRDNALRSAYAKRGVLLTTYGMVLHNAESLARRGGSAGAFL